MMRRSERSKKRDAGTYTMITQGVSIRQGGMYIPRCYIDRSGELKQSLV